MPKDGEKVFTYHDKKITLSELLELMDGMRQLTVLERIREHLEENAGITGTALAEADIRAHNQTRRKGEGD